MKRNLTLIALLFAFSATLVVAQNRQMRGIPVADPQGTLPSGSQFRTTADTIITADTTTYTRVIDMFGAERKPKTAPTTWARVFNTADPNNSKVDISPIFFGWPDPVNGQPVTGNMRGVGVEYNVWVTNDSSLYSIPDRYTINSLTFLARTAVNRTDGEADTFAVSVHPLTYQVNGSGNLELKPNLDTTMAVANQLIFSGNASNGLILAAPPNAQGQYSFYISSSPVTVNINHTVENLDMGQYDPGFALFVRFSGAAGDTVMMPGWAYEQYTANPPATVTDTWETSGYYENYNVYYRYTNNLTGDVVLDFDTLASGWFNDASLQHFDMKCSVSYDVITFDTTVGRNESLAGTLLMGELFPNPASNGQVVSVPFSTSKAQPVSISVLNAMGQVVSNTRYESVIPGSHRFDLPVSNLAAGVYMVRVDAQAGSFVRRLVVN